MCRTPPNEALVASTSAPLEVDDIQSDDAYGDELSSYSASLTSSVVNFPTIGGRRYHAYREGRYLLPNDETESDRLDIHHELVNKILGGRLHVAPISEKPQRVLDLCTGTGIWVIDFADEHPSAEVTGNDLSPTQPSMVPPNAKFIVDDVEDDWGYEETPFDYVHGRFLVGSIRDWPRLMGQAFSCTKPGGWVEFQEWDANIHSEDDSIKGTSLFKLQDTVKSVFEDTLGINVNPGPDMAAWLEKEGFVNIKTEKYKVPLGTWPRDPYMKTLGTFNLLQHLEGLEGIANVPLSKIGWSQEEIQVLLAQARADLKDRKVHSLFDYYVVYAQKPH